MPFSKKYAVVICLFFSMGLAQAESDCKKDCERSAQMACSMDARIDASMGKAATECFNHMVDACATVGRK